MTAASSILAEIDAFLTEVGMGQSYFGKAAVGNSEIVRRLRVGGRVWPETESKLRAFMASVREKRQATEAEKGAF